MNGIRSWLYVPAAQPHRVAKALSGDADAVVIDLEDSVPAAGKAAARDLLAGTLGDVLAAPGHKPVAVRVNALPGPGADDLRALSGLPLTAVRLPKTEDPGEVRRAADLLPGVDLHLLVESALGLRRCFELAGCAPSVRALLLGEGDLSRDLGSGHPAIMDAARFRVLLAARAAGLPAPSLSVFRSLDDLDALRADTLRGKDLGFFGRSVVHPRQVPVVNAVFAPDPAEIAEARAVLAAAADAGTRGTAAWRTADGEIADLAAVRAAEDVLARAAGTEDR
ncbi:HpcH/HpaI aldolase/citrate lyase family protein [Actinomadura rayongensis]|uniref:CoA ester lyase n=1 Tax=Actinomadura rayongensis TaxID=1429076 RepID=A0A6I4WHP3_9ACTN|nr:CoA ester lyase [Actinomadura rayongensis]MXQ67845.1 CoA ester lyase [Actinomadura rayongensis]